MATVSVDALVNAPCPRVGVTITGLGVGDSVVSVWRTADEERHPVRGTRRTHMNDGAYVVDYDAPLGRPITYEVEVLSGPLGPSRTTSDVVVVESETGWIMDPLVPRTAVPVVGGEGNEAYLRPAALAQLEYEANVQMYEIMGSDKPMALFGQRMAESNIDTSLGTDSAVQNARLKKLLRSTAQLLFRPLPSWGQFEMSGTMFLANPKATQIPVNISWGGECTWWDIKSDVVEAPVIKVLTSTFTYGDVKMFMSTYQQKQDLMAGKTYLEDLKNPIG